VAGRTGARALFTELTTQSITSPRKGRNTRHMYLTLKDALPVPSRIMPLPMLSTLVTAMMKPYRPLHVPSI